MQFTLCKQSALAILRSLRASSAHIAADAGQSGMRQGEARSSRTDLLPPDPSPGQRFTRSRLDNLDFGLPRQCAHRTLDFAVPDGDSRIRMKDSSWTVYGKGVPSNAFIGTRFSADDLSVAISGPELLFAELAKDMHPVEHLMLGHELCGTFSRDAADPYNGPITYGIKPATTVDRIRRFLDEARSIRGLDAARRTLAFLNDNAWSPTESLVAALLRLPMDNLGYGFGDLALNPRKAPSAFLPGAARSRVPDIMISGTPVGINYDGAVHLDLGSVVDAARELEANPHLLQSEQNLHAAIKEVRIKVVDDIRRNRELAAGGLAVFPIVKEDLYPKGGLDRIVAHLITIIEQTIDRNMDEQKRILGKKRLAEARWRMALSLLPGNHERNIHVNRFIRGNELVEGPGEVLEYWIEF